MKKFWKYLTLTILFVLGLGCVGVLYLFFVPTSTLFNIAYITHHDSITSTEYSVENLEEVQLFSQNYDVKVIATETDKVSVKMYSNAFGFVHTKNENALIFSNYDSDKNIAKFEVKEPSGFIFKSASYIELYIPEDKEIDLIIKNKKAETNFSLSETGVKTLTYSAEKGKAYLNSGKVSNLLDLELKGSTFKISNEVAVKDSNVKLSVTTGKFDASSSTLKDIDIVKNERGVVLVDTCNNIIENVKTAGGRIEAKAVSFINVTSTETNVYVGKISNGAIIDLSGSGNVSIEELTGSSSTINSGYGKINLNKVNSEIYVKTTNGTINISNAHLLINLQIEGTGKAKISFAEEAESFSSNHKSRTIYALTKSGSLTCSGVENINISSSGNSSFDINMKNVFGSNSVHNKNGSTKIVINKDSVYKLTTNPDEETVASVRVNLSQTEEYNGYTTKTKRETWVNCGENANNGNTLVVSNSTGSMIILDTNFNK